VINRSLNKLADQLVNDGNKFKKLQELGNRKNYPYKIQQLTDRIQEQYDLFLKKGSSPRLTDLEKDLNFVKNQTNSNFNKERIDILVGKYL